MIDIQLVIGVFIGSTSAAAVFGLLALCRDSMKAEPSPEGYILRYGFGYRVIMTMLTITTPIVIYVLITKSLAVSWSIALIVAGTLTFFCCGLLCHAYTYRLEITPTTVIRYNCFQGSRSLRFADICDISYLPHDQALVMTTPESSIQISRFLDGTGILEDILPASIQRQFESELKRFT